MAKGPEVEKRLSVDVSRFFVLVSVVLNDGELVPDGVQARDEGQPAKSEHGEEQPIEPEHGDEEHGDEEHGDEEHGDEEHGDEEFSESEHGDREKLTTQHMLVANHSVAAEDDIEPDEDASPEERIHWVQMGQAKRRYFEARKNRLKRNKPVAPFF